MKKGIVCFLLILWVMLPIGMIAQQRVEYTYNKNGSRVTRKVVVIPVSTRQTTGIDGDIPADVTSDFLSEKTIKIYPNPTKGDLRIDVYSSSGNDQDNESEKFIIYRIFNSAGVKILEELSDASSVSLNFSDYPAGWYILRLSTGNNSREYKIIKE